jgi:hypothetical protein
VITSERAGPGLRDAACQGGAPEDRFASRVRSTLRRRYP